MSLLKIVDSYHVFYKEGVVMERKRENEMNICIKRFDQNIAVLKETDVQLYDRVVNYKNKNEYKLDINSGSYNLYSLNRDEHYYENENLLYNVKLKIEEFNINNAQLVFFLGIGLGYELLYFLKEKAAEQKTKKIVIVEPEIEVFIYALHAVDFREIFRDKNVTLLISNDLNIVEDVFNKYFMSLKTLHLAKASKVLYYPSSYKWNKDYFDKVIGVFKEQILYNITYYGNSPEDSLIGLRHMFDNITEIVENPGVNLLYNQFKGVPAVVVASGPSLKKNIHLLKEIEGKAMIFCAESTLKILLQHGIKPNVVTALERVPETADSLRDIDPDISKDIYFAGCPVIPKEAYDVYTGPKLIAYRKFDHFRWLQIDRGLLDIKASAANMAFKLADKFGCDPIVLVGQDLSMDPDGVTTHMTGHGHGEQQEFFNNNGLFEVLGNNGEMVLTNWVWNLFLQGYRDDLRQYDGLCINATEGGAYIEGTTLMTLSETIDQYLQNDIDVVANLKKVLKTFENEDINEIYEKLDERLENAISDIEEIIEDCKEGIALIAANQTYLKELFAKADYTKEESKEILDLFREVFSKRDNFLSKGETFQLLLMHIVQPILLKYDIDLNEIPGLHKQEEKKYIAMIEFMYKWYAVMMKIITIVYEELKVTKEKIAVE